MNEQDKTKTERRQNEDEAKRQIDMVHRKIESGPAGNSHMWGYAFQTEDCSGIAGDSSMDAQEIQNLYVLSRTCGTGQLCGETTKRPRTGEKRVKNERRTGKDLRQKRALICAQAAFISCESPLTAGFREEAGDSSHAGMNCDVSRDGQEDLRSKTPGGVLRDNPRRAELRISCEFSM
jgi:hypothetical protein